MLLAVAEVESAWAPAVGAAVLELLGGRSQRWLADGTDMDPATISRIIKGKQLPTLDQIDVLARRLGVSRQAFLVVAGYLDDSNSTLSAIENDPWLEPDQRNMLVTSYKVATAGRKRRRGGDNHLGEGD